MANPIVILNPHITLNSVDLSDHVKKATLDLAADVQDATAGSSGGWKANKPGQKGGTLSLEFVDDFDADKVDATLAAAFGTIVAFVLKHTDAAVATANPQWAGNVVVNSYGFGGAINTTAAKSMSFPLDGAATRTTS